MTTWTKRARVAGAIALAALLGACGGAMQKPASAEPSPAVLSADPRQAHAEIDTLMQRTDADMATLGATPASPMSAPTPATAAHAIPGTCAPPPDPSPTCRDVQTIAERVCDAATRICELAADLPGDDWATGRCNASTASCATAHQRSCDCR
jgi:hypothetical protein